jgi:hypothetical protein
MFEVGSKQLKSVFCWRGFERGLEFPFNCSQNGTEILKLQYDGKNAKRREMQ